MRATRPEADRFWDKVDKNGPTPVHRPDLGPCWLYTGALDDHGYGVFYVRTGEDGRKLHERAHQVAWRLTRGSIPEGTEHDHLCLIKSCCNPDHLDPVPHAVNTQRHYALTTTCPQGHPYDEDNTRIDRRGKRVCRTCHREQERARWRRLTASLMTAAALLAPVVVRPHSALAWGALCNPKTGELKYPGKDVEETDAGYQPYLDAGWKEVRGPEECKKKEHHPFPPTTTPTSIPSPTATTTSQPNPTTPPSATPSSPGSPAGSSSPTATASTPSSPPAPGGPPASGSPPAATASPPSASTSGPSIPTAPPPSSGSSSPATDQHPPDQTVIWICLQRPPSAESPTGREMFPIHRDESGRYRDQWVNVDARGYPIEGPCPTPPAPPRATTPSASTASTGTRGPAGGPSPTTTPPPTEATPTPPRASATNSPTPPTPPTAPDVPEPAPVVVEPVAPVAWNEPEVSPPTAVVEAPAPAPVEDYTSQPGSGPGKG